MPLIVKPNWRKMQAFRDSPSERGLVSQPRPAAFVLSRTVLVVGAIAIGLVLLAVFGVHLRLP